MSTITHTAAAVTCVHLGERHTDDIEYRTAPHGWVRLGWRPGPAGEELTLASVEIPHILHCTRHAPPMIYASIKESEAGITLEGIPLLENPGYILAAMRLAESLAHLPVLKCPEGTESIWGFAGRVMVDGQFVERGRYRLDYDDGVPRTLSV